MFSHCMNKGVEVAWNQFSTNKYLWNIQQPTFILNCVANGYYSQLIFYLEALSSKT